jgi:hypothetical protein
MDKPPVLKAAFDAWLAPYRTDRQDIDAQGGVFILKRGKGDNGGRQLTVTFKSAHVLQAETQAAEAAEAESKAEAEALAAEVDELRQQEKASMTSRQIAEAMRKYVTGNWPDADWSDVLAEAMDIATTEAEATEAEAEADTTAEAEAA